MRASKGRGMSDEQVMNFVNGCMFLPVRFQELCVLTSSDYPAYELYTQVLRDGIFGGEKGKQMRLVVDKNRRVKDVHKL